MGTWNPQANKILLEALELDTSTRVRTSWTRRALEMPNSAPPLINCYSLTRRPASS